MTKADAKEMTRVVAATRARYAGCIERALTEGKDELTIIELRRDSAYAVSSIIRAYNEAR